MAEMVWCQSCKTVVWAYDHQRPVDIRGIVNMFGLPCPKCSAEGNFDGFGFDRFTGILRSLGINPEGVKVYDAWSAMKAMASWYKLAWDPSPDNRWFPQKVKEVK